MRAIIVDDERLAREELRGLLTAHPFVEICGEASCASEARELVRSEKPDLVFLDIEMPGKNGFDFLEELPAPHPQIVFVTAYDAFALRAFEVNALDYLMKPVHPKRLAAALEKLRGQASEADGSSEFSSKAFEVNDRIFIRDGERCLFVPIVELRLLETEGNYTRLHLRKDTTLLYRTLNSLELRLPESLFIRANRSQIVNMRFIESIEPWFSGGLKAKLSDGVQVEFSRRQAKALREKTGL